MRAILLNLATALISVTIILSACATSYIPADPPAYRTIKPGARFQLNEVLEIPPDKAAVYIQYGKIIPSKLKEVYQPSCRLVVNGLSKESRTVNPDTFMITRITYGTELVMAKPFVLAGLSIQFSSAGGDDGGATAENYSTYFYLQSEKQPLVSHISCEYWEDPNDGSHLSTKQITAALGKIIELQQ